MNQIQEDILMHYGVKRRSGRYPWGSGETPFQHGGDFLSRVEELQQQGKSEKDIAEELNMSTTDLRMQVRVAKHERRMVLADKAKSLRDEGKTLDEIASIMGYNNDSSVRALLNENTATNKAKAWGTAEKLKEELSKKGALDVGVGAERTLGVSNGVLQEALFILETEGYNRYGVGVPQVNDPKKRTITPVVSVPEITQADAYKDLSLIKSVGDYHTTDGGKSWDKREYPSSINSDRVKVLYGDEGGKAKDGVIELRRGVADLNLGDSHYAQVRIMVDDTHYLKGMAMYGDDKDFPPGVDVIFNTNKMSGTPKEKVFKELQKGPDGNPDPDNPFGAYIKANGQSYYPDPNGKYTDPITGEKQSLSAINKLKEEGDWDKMSKNLSSQFLSKQPLKLIQSQLDQTYADSFDEYSEICALTNPTVKKKLLLDFADECDSAAIHLKAAALPRQSTQVILPLTCINDNEIYAPNYDDGEKVALVRYPHAGTFEIPILTVNNKNAGAKSILGPNIQDAVGIHPSTAERLSGADFDGDQVVVIPTRGVNIKSTRPLDGLKDFDPKVEYSTEGKTGIRLMSKENTQIEMGKISNLITDMTLKGANESEIVKAVKHSMVVIDAAKHKLDYKRSEQENDIATLKARWQGYVDPKTGKDVGGASTLLSRRKQEVEVNERQGSGRIDKETGKVIYKESGRTYTDPKTGKTVVAKTKISIIDSVDDVHELSSGTRIEDAYADHANRMKALANQARIEYTRTPTLARSSSAAKAYDPEVQRLMSALRLAQQNSPREREAQRIANTRSEAKIKDNNVTDKDEKAKIRRAAINDARIEVGANGKNTRISITDGEWKAIQAGAISDTTLREILRYADPDRVRELSTPKTRTEVSESRKARIKNMANSYTNQEIAKMFNLSPSTVSQILKE